jgi:serine/threonine protein phosphatase PrpC
MPWQFDLASDIGARAEQQDRVAVLQVPGREDAHLVVLADGMGGQQQGAEAAQAVVDSARTAIALFGDGDTSAALLRTLCLAADRAVRAIGRADGGDPGSTCALLYLDGREAYWAHVGDSRLYHFEAKRLLFRTADHSVAELLAGEKDAATEGQRDSRLYMCLGGRNRVEPEIGSAAVGARDWFLLCSDGLWSQLDEADLLQTAAAQSAQGGAAHIAALARQRGGAASDNISLVLARQQPRGMLGRMTSPRTWFTR